jgi:hypothetical protein
MDALQPLHDLLPLWVGEAVVHQLKHQQGGVERPLARACDQLPRVVQLSGDGWYAIG